jgi:RNA polymerase sigma-70 factor (ECF subfamily)
MQERDRLDAADIRRIRAGDTAAFGGLVARHARRVHDLARRMLRDSHEAEDITQHAFLNAYKALDRFDVDRPFRHWLLRIASNLCRNRIAARQARRKTPPPIGGDDPLPETADPDRPLEVPADAEERRAAVRAAIECLPERYRLAVVLFYVHDCSVHEISEVTEAPAATVKTWLHRGRAALRDLLEPPETPPEGGGMEE